MRLSILLLLFVLATAHCQGERKSNSKQPLEHNSELHMQDFPYIPITQTNTPITSTKTNIPATSKKTRETFFYVFLPWFYLFNNVYTAFNVQDSYRKEKFCFTFAIVLIIAQFQIGLLQMLASDTICSSLRLKGVYFLSLVIANTIAFSRIIFSRRLKWKQFSVLTTYISIMLITVIYDRQLYESIQKHLFLFSPIIHLYELKEKHKAIDYDSISSIEFRSYNINALFFA